MLDRYYYSTIVHFGYKNIPIDTLFFDKLIQPNISFFIKADFKVLQERLKIRKNTFLETHLNKEMIVYANQKYSEFDITIINNNQSVEDSVQKIITKGAVLDS